MVCECGEVIVVDSVVRGVAKEEKVLSLSQCPKCGGAPIRRRAHILNVVTTAIRRHQAKFYSGYVSCEDPACNARTRQLPLRFSAGYPECTTCKKAGMAKDYTDKQLYTQLLFYRQLFDVARASARYGRNFNHDLAGIADGQANYALLKAHVDKVMDLNNYSIVDMTRLFSAFSATSAAKFRRGKLT